MMRADCWSDCKLNPTRTKHCVRRSTRLFIRCSDVRRSLGRISPRIAGLVAIATALACSQSTPQAEIAQSLAELRPLNFVFIIVDTLRADWTTPYGSREDTSPEIARWAERGVLFERVRSQSSWTKISVASIMTSLWPRTHGIREAQDGLGRGAITLAEVMQDAGWTTWGVQTNGWLHQSFGFHQGFDRYMFPRGGTARHLEKPSVWPHADRLVEEAFHFIDEHDRARPFFLYLHFMDVHEYAAPPDFKTFGTDSRGAYLAAIRWVDDAIARVRKKLDSAGYLDQTVMVFAADHGETFGEHGVHGHARNVLTPVIWVPLVVRFPFSVEPIRIRSQVRNIDIAPTLVELAGLAIPEAFEGESLVRQIGSGDRESDRASFASLGLPLFPDAAEQDSVNDGTWTYARNGSGEASGASRSRRGVALGKEFLFDRRIDPGENVNLIDREPAAASRMRAMMDRHLDGAVRANVLESGVRIDPSIADRLRAMGYLQ